MRRLQRPAEHAEPLEAQMPSKSSPASNGMLSEPSTTKADRVGKPLLARADELHPRQSVNQANQALGQRGQLFPVENRRADKAFQGLDQTDDAARFSVPARRSFSWLPPNRIGSGCSGDLT